MYSVGKTSIFRFRRRTELACAVFGTVAIAICPTIARAGPCDLNWDGDALAHIAQGRNPLQEMSLLDTKQKVFASLRGEQILAISEAKAAIAKQLGRSPSLVFCYEGEPNAFATNTSSGEVVGVTLGLVATLNGDRDMAAFVIGHEYAHLVLGHIDAAEQRRAALSLLGELAGVFLEVKTQTKTNVQGIGMEVGRLGASLTSYKFDRDQEREADKAGFGYMVDAGFNPLGAVRLAETMQRYGAGGIGLFFDNHPGWPERTERFQALIKASPKAQATIARTGARTMLATASTDGRQPQVAVAPIYAASDAEKSLADGLAELDRKDFQAAVTDIRRSASTGYAPAQNVLGYLYIMGLAGLPKDETEGVRLLRLAVAQSNASATNNLGAMYWLGLGGVVVDKVEAVRLYRQAANLGDPIALKNMGKAYQFGWAGIEKDDNAARKYYQQAADAGNADATARLGWYHEYGLAGLTNDTRTAISMYRKAADKGSADGIYYLARCYEFGNEEIHRDEVEAVKWLQLSASRGDILGEYDLAAMYTRGAGGLPKDETKAAELFKLSADGGLAPAQAVLGKMYVLGKGGLSKDPAEAVRLFQLSAAQADPAGQYYLGLLYEFGEGGLPKDTKTAVSWYQKAAAQGNADAAKKLGDLHVN